MPSKAPATMRPCSETCAGASGAGALGRCRLPRSGTLPRLASRDIGDLALGSETQADWKGSRRLNGSPQAHRIILSLDFAGDRFLGPAADPEAAGWPARVIVMTLARSAAARVRTRPLAPDHGEKSGAPARSAGGVRDLMICKGSAMPGPPALVASALHDGRIGPRRWRTSPAHLLAPFSPNPKSRRSANFASASA